MLDVYSVVKLEALILPRPEVALLALVTDFVHQFIKRMATPMAFNISPQSCFLPGLLTQGFHTPTEV
jgi:hypothetical protein